MTIDFLSSALDKTNNIFPSKESNEPQAVNIFGFQLQSLPISLSNYLDIQGHSDNFERARMRIFLGNLELNAVDQKLANDDDQEPEEDDLDDHENEDEFDEDEGLDTESDEGEEDEENGELGSDEGEFEEADDEDEFGEDEDEFEEDVLDLDEDDEDSYDR